MPSIAELYVAGVRKKLQYYYAAWLPNEVLKIGDVGVLDKGIFFKRETALSLLGINFAVRADPSPTPFSLQSERGVQIASKAAGEINTKAPNIPKVNAGIAVDFSAKAAFVIKAALTYEPAIEDIATLQKQIIDLYKNNRWKKEWVVITKLVNTPRATILVSRSSESKIELAAEGNFATGSTVQLGDARVKFNVSFTSGDIIDLTDAQDISPFFQLAGLKRHLLKDDTVQLLRVGNYLSDPMDLITPAVVRDNEKVASSLFLDLIR